MKTIFLSIIAVFAATRLSSNPIAFDSHQSYLRLVGEHVIVNVGQHVAVVKGDFQFALISEAIEQRDSYYRILLPVYSDMKDIHPDILAALYKPSLSINDRRYEFSEVQPFSPPADAKIPALVRPLLCFEAKIPRSVGSQFLARISYS